MQRTLPLLVVLWLSAPLGALAQDTHSHHAPGMDHSAPLALSHSMATEPTETGQSAFAAIQEIVERLEADPSTDWSNVDIEALRQHLIDMNNVTLAAHVVSESIDNGLRYTVTGADAVKASIQRMVSAHAAMMDGTDGWHYSVEAHPHGARLTITVTAADDRLKLRALSFIGVMARGMHHQRHHWMIATGQSPHH